MNMRSAFRLETMSIISHYQRRVTLRKARLAPKFTFDLHAKVSDLTSTPSNVEARNSKDVMDENEALVANEVPSDRGQQKQAVG